MQLLIGSLIRFQSKNILQLCHYNSKIPQMMQQLCHAAEYSHCNTPCSMQFLTIELPFGE
jgi:hypothetical protein